MINFNKLFLRASFIRMILKTQLTISSFDNSLIFSNINSKYSIILIYIRLFLRLIILSTFSSIVFLFTFIFKISLIKSYIKFCRFIVKAKRIRLFRFYKFLTIFLKPCKFIFFRIIHRNLIKGPTNTTIKSIIINNTRRKLHNLNHVL